MSSLIFAFDYFDPLNGEIPTIHGFNLEPITRRARQILNDRNREEIDFALKSLLWMIEQCETQALFQHITEGIADWEAQDEPERATLSEAQVLLHHMDGFDITGQPNLSKAAWPEYFAILTLAHIGGITLLLRGPITTSELPETEKTMKLMEFAAPSVISATEAIAMAEALPKGRYKKKKISQQAIVLRSQKAISKRWSKPNEIKRSFLKFYNNGKFSGVAEAARIFYSDLNPDDQESLCETKDIVKVVRTLQETVKNFKRTNRLPGKY